MFFVKYFVKYCGISSKYQMKFCSFFMAWMKVFKIQQIFMKFSKSF